MIFVNSPRNPKRYDTVFSEALREPTGFENRSHSNLSFSVVSSLARVTIEPDSPTYTSYNIWFGGVKHTISSLKYLDLPDTEGTHVIYFDTDETLKSFLNPGYGDMLTVIKDKVIVGIVYWDATNKMIVYDGEERHGTIMDGITHYYLHYTKGLAWVEGCGLGSFVIGNGTLDSHAQFSVASGLVTDEDIGLGIDAITSTTGIPIVYKSGASGYWRRLSQPGFACYRGPTNTRLSYNQYTAGAWKLTEVTNNDFVLYHLFMTTGYDDAIFSVMGEAEYGNVNLAKQGAATELSNLLLEGLISPEIHPLGTVIYQTGNYGNTVNARIVLTDTGENYVDWRTNDIPRGSTPSDHGNLVGLADDDHLQYALADQSRGFSTYSATKSFTTVEGTHTVTITNGLVTNWTIV